MPPIDYEPETGRTPTTDGPTRARGKAMVAGGRLVAFGTVKNPPDTPETAAPIAAPQLTGASPFAAAPHPDATRPAPAPLMPPVAAPSPPMPPVAASPVAPPLAPRPAAARPPGRVYFEPSTGAMRTLGAPGRAPVPAAPLAQPVPMSGPLKVSPQRQVPASPQGLAPQTGAQPFPPSQPLTQSQPFPASQPLARPQPATGGMPVTPVATRSAAGPAGPRPPDGGRGRRVPAPPPARRPFRRHPVVLAIWVVLLLALGTVSFSVGHVLSLPGTDSTAARLAEWSRDHHLNFAVTYLEKIDYNMHKPKAGGLPAGGIPNASGQTPTASPTLAAIPHTAAPAAVSILAGGQPIANEGKWQTVVTVKDLPAVRVSYVRPDNEHTSYLSALMWMDPKLLAGRLHPGYQDPGGQWSTPTFITPQLRNQVAAANNGGFRLNASRGGLYLEGRTPQALRTGAASLVLYKDGTANVGAWGTDVKMTPQVSVVRQNLDVLVENGQVNPTCSDNNSPTWGYTLGNVSFVWRSGFGVTRDGGLIYVTGDALSVCSLGRVMAAAGIVRGMELDINPEWTTGYYFTHPNDTSTVPHKLSPAQAKPVDRYFTTQSRDFFAWYIRP